MSVVVDDDDVRVEIAVTDVMVQTVFNRVVAFFEEHGAWSGESVMQRDGPQLAAAEFLADLVDDVLKPKVVTK
jgi:hypothetical protein